MSETSFPWAGTAAGDHGPYSDAQWSDAWRKLFLKDRAKEGVLGGYANELAPANPSGQNIRIDTGAALVDGKFYEASASTDFTLSLPGSGLNRYDRIVLRKSWAAQTVRLALLSGAEAVSPSVPALTQSSGDTWEIPVCKAYITDAGAVTLTDERSYCRFAGVPVHRRQGGSAANWSTNGTTAYTPAKAGIQAGAAPITLTSAASGSVIVTFPEAFSGTPLAWASSNEPNYVVSVTSLSATACTLTVSEKDGQARTVSFSVYWLAVGKV
jgi:hypothetical protein